MFVYIGLVCVFSLVLDWIIVTCMIRFGLCWLWLVWAVGWRLAWLVGFVFVWMLCDVVIAYVLVMVNCCFWALDLALIWWFAWFVI